MDDLAGTPLYDVLSAPVLSLLLGTTWNHDPGGGPGKSGPSLVLGTGEGCSLARGEEGMRGGPTPLPAPAPATDHPWQRDLAPPCCEHAFADTPAVLTRLSRVACHS